MQYAEVTIRYFRLRVRVPKDGSYVTMEILVAIKVAIPVYNRVSHVQCNHVSMLL
jgi:hypothetical protein